MFIDHNISKAPLSNNLINLEEIKEEENEGAFGELDDNKYQNKLDYNINAK